MTQHYIGNKRTIYINEELLGVGSPLSKEEKDNAINENYLNVVNEKN